MTDTISMDLIEARKTASRLASRSHMHDVRLIRANAEILALPPLDSHLAYDLHTGPSVDFNGGDKFFVVRFAYDLTIFRVADEGDESDASTGDADPNIASIKFEYAALYSLMLADDDLPPKAEELEAYAASTGHFALYPFARQFVYDITSRLALPPLTLDVMVLPPVKTEAETEAEV